MQSAYQSKMNFKLERTEKKIGETLQKYNVPSISFVVVSGDEPVYFGNFGKCDIENDIKPDKDTVYACASVSKAFTVTCLGILKDRGMVEWDVPVRRYAPEIEMFDRETADMTLSDMISHNTGMPRHDYSWINYFDRDFTTAECMARLKYLKPNKCFRTKWEYNNFMFAAAGFVVEKLSGMSLPEFMKHNIFDPLGMTNTSCDIAGLRDKANAAKPYRLVGGKVVRAPYLTFDCIAGAGAVNSTASDMARWVAMNMNGGEFKGVRIIKEETLREIHTPRTVVPDDPDCKTVIPHMPLQAYGYGWFVQPYRDNKCLQHGGNTDGFSAYITFMPEKKLGLMIFVNLESSAYRDAIAAVIYDDILGLDDGTDWMELFYAQYQESYKKTLERTDKIKKSRDPERKPTRALCEYAGRYEHKGYGTLEIKECGEGLVLAYNGQDFPLNHNNYDVFDYRVEETDPENLLTVSFIPDEEGKMSTVAIPFEAALDEPIPFKRKQA